MAGAFLHWVLRVAVVAVLVAGGAAAAASDDNPIYLYRQSNGVRVYTDRKPDHSAWVIIAKYGRPTASASCTGLTAQSLDARASTYAPLIAKYASARGVPAALVRAVMRVESCFDHRAVSRVGARGLMQLMPETAAEMGVSDSFDPEQNISGGVHYLSMMLERFHQNRELALAAYNAGPEAVEKHGGIPPFPETQSYVRRVIASYRQQT